MKMFWMSVAVLACASFMPFAKADEPAPPQPDKPASTEVKTGVFRITIGADGKAQITGAPAAEADKKPQPGQPAQPEIRVETRELGKVIQLGPDGKTAVKEFQGKIPAEILEKLPEELRRRLQKEQADTTETQATGVTTTVKVFVAKDGKLEEVETDLGKAAGVSGVLPGGLEEMLRKAGVKLPVQIQRSEEASPRKEKTKARKRKGATEGATLEEVNAKLDKLLNRLERLEKEVQKLKGQ